MLNDILAAAGALRDAGGWTVALVMGLAFLWAIRRGTLVWDWQYLDKVELVKKLTATVERLTLELERERRRRRQDPPRGPA